jgi:aminoglycoside phosphotransferase (APT) family kinase protein
MHNGVTALSTGTPVAEFAVDEELVARLLADQHADLAHLPLRPVDAGWDNQVFRLGDDLAVRLPRRAAVAHLILHEQRWLPGLAKALPLPVPAPYRIGKPAFGYPCVWSVVPWFSGSAADQTELPPSQAVAFGKFLRALHGPAPPEAPTNAFRGGPLQQRVASVQARMDRLDSRSDVLAPGVLRIWQEALEAPREGKRTWLHGDLHPRNVVVEKGVITGIIDWGDITAGDCATDLASIWMLFTEPEIRQAALTAYGKISEATRRRSKGWAIFFGVMLLDTGLGDNPRNAALGERILRCVGNGG